MTFRPVGAGLAALAIIAWVPVGAAGRGPAQLAAPQANGAAVVGAWQLDRARTADSQETWRRSVDAMRANEQVPPGNDADPLATALMRQIDSPDWRLRTAMRDLLEVAERLDFRVGQGKVTITDDLDRALTFATGGDREKHQLAATEFHARTKWNGEALTQDISADLLALSVVYLPSDDGRALLMSIKVVRPQFSPPFKEITRIYVRRPS
jgi:hypothetical protein